MRLAPPCGCVRRSALLCVAMFGRELRKWGPEASRPWSLVGFSFGRHRRGRRLDHESRGYPEVNNQDVVQDVYGTKSIPLFCPNCRAISSSPPGIGEGLTGFDPPPFPLEFKTLNEAPG